MFTSQSPGDGKTFAIHRLMKGSRLKTEKNQRFTRAATLLSADAEKPEQGPEQSESKFIQFVIGGDIGVDSLQKRLKRFVSGTEPVDYLYLKVAFVEQIHLQSPIINDFLFNLCKFKFFWFRGEPFFFKKELKIFIEVESYQNDILLNSISFLELLPRFEQKFDLRKLECVPNSVENPIQSCCIFINRILEEGNDRPIDLAPYENFNSVARTERPPDKPEVLDAQDVQRLLNKYYLENPNLKKPVSFASVVLFCRIVDYEFRNINQIVLINNTPLIRKKKELLRLIIEIAVRLTNPSLEAISTQLNTLNRFQKEDTLDK